MKATLHTDGGSRGNPGDAGIGYVLVIEGKAPIEHGAYIGHTTNNQAEYQALLAGLARAQEAGVTELACYLDSELVVKQLAGEYRVRDMHLTPLYEEAVAFRSRFNALSFTYVPRVQNKRADKLVNIALNNKNHEL